jgi:hypothetical protein
MKLSQYPVLTREQNGDKLGSLFFERACHEIRLPG